MEFLTRGNWQNHIGNKMVALGYATKVDGQFYRRPFDDEHLGHVNFYEPVLDAGPLIPGITDIIPIGVGPVRVINCGPEKANHMFAYFQIKLEKLLTDGGGIKRFHSDAPRQFRKVKQEAEEQSTAPTWSIMDEYDMIKIVEGYVDDMSGSDLASIYCWFNSPNHYAWRKLMVASHRAYFLTYSSADTLYSSVILTDSHVSLMTYFLAQWAFSNGYKYLDLWNVSLTPRERYKRAFFTAAVERSCFFNGDTNQYPWLRRI